MRALGGGVYNSVELTFVSWQRGSFLVGKILINTCILRDHFIIGIPLIRINCGVQDISLYKHLWRLSKATLDPSRSLFPLTSLFPSAFLSSHWPVVLFEYSRRLV